jgi:hypothetical protein
MPSDPSRAGDDELLRDLRAVVERVDPPPPSLTAAAQALLSWRTVDAELAELVFDSLVDEPGVLTRGARSGDAALAASARLLSFEASGLTIAVEVVDAGDAGERRRLTGQLDPAQPARVEVRDRRGILPLDADRLGRFTADVGAGPVSLRCRVGATPGRGVVVTDWVVL